MQIQTYSDGGTCTISVAGSMADQADVEKLNNIVERLMGEGHRDFVIDMAKIDNIGSAAMSGLAQALDAVNRSRGHIQLANLQATHRNLLEAAAFDSLVAAASTDVSLSSNIQQPPQIAAAPQAGVLTASAQTIDTADPDTTDTEAPATEQTSTEPDAQSTIQVPEAEQNIKQPKQAEEWRDTVLIEMPSTHDSIAEASRKFTSFLRKLSVDHNVQFDMQVAFNEAVSNAVKHGNKSDASRCVTAFCKAKPGMIHVSVMDEGDGFDIAATTQRASDPLQDHGRGLLLIKSLVDSVSYNETGNAINMVKYL